MKKNSLLQLGLLITLCAVIGLLLPQQFSRVQRIQSLFIQADDQLYSADCTPVALGAVPVVLDQAPEKCKAIARARDIYDGLSYPEARDAFDKDLFRDQAVFSGISAILGLFLYLTIGLCNSLRVSSKRTKRSSKIASLERGSEQGS